MSTELRLDSEWAHRLTGETMRVLYWERGEVLFRKLRGADGLVGPTFRLKLARFLSAYTPVEADYKCNLCGQVTSRKTLGWRTWLPSYCEKLGKLGRLYRIT
jgi:hypothetical protein